MSKTWVQETKAKYLKAFPNEKKNSQDLLVVISPARINFLGEHVDYNDGFVLPAAISKAICFVCGRSEGQQLTIIADDLIEDQSLKIDLNSPINKDDKGTWKNYILGVASQMSHHPKLSGANILFSSTIPMGAGLSSSAALSCGFGFAMSELFGLEIPRKEIAQMGQKAEHTFVGTQCGIMDQFANVFGQANAVIRLDCKSLDFAYHRGDFKDYTVLLLDTCVKHSLQTSEYNQRRQECQQGLQALKKAFPHITSFRDCSMQDVRAIESSLSETVFRRIKYVVEEIERTQQAAKAIDQNDFITLGRLMYETHQGLSKEYEVSCPELDFLVHQVQSRPEVAGARVMGGGFGGCTINLVLKGKEQNLIEDISKAYRSQFGIDLKAYQAEISDGLRVYTEGQ